jgi:hypothetical protein
VDEEVDEGEFLLHTVIVHNGSWQGLPLAINQRNEK